MDRRALVNHYRVESGASRYFNWVDTDGSASLRGRPTIVGSWANWWQVGGRLARGAGGACLRRGDGARTASAAACQSVRVGSSPAACPVRPPPQVGDDCTYVNEWSTWLCDKLPHREVARLDVRVPGYTAQVRRCWRCWLQCRCWRLLQRRRPASCAHTTTTTSTLPPARRWTLAGPSRPPPTTTPATWPSLGGAAATRAR